MVGQRREEEAAHLVMLIILQEMGFGLQVEINRTILITRPVLARENHQINMITAPQHVRRDGKVEGDKVI